MSFLEAVRYLESLINYETARGYSYKQAVRLERITVFLATLGDPQATLRVVHVAGTKGKGSVSAAVAYMLRAAGYTTGLYTSPHLSTIRERIRILHCFREQDRNNRGAGRRLRLSKFSLRENSGFGSSITSHSGCYDPARRSVDDFEGMISEQELIDLVDHLRPAIEAYNRDSVYGALTFFEVYTALAFMYFSARKVDYAVLETGMGGRLDATTACNPAVCVLTAISLDHTQQLGETIAQIAVEKAGIITSPGIPVISAPQDPEAMAVIEQRCRAIGAPLFVVGKQIVSECRGQTCTVTTPNARYGDLTFSLLGDHQMVNAVCAVGAVDALAPGCCVSEAAVRSGLAAVRWPGRCEVLCRSPLIIVDGAHNTASVQALKQTVSGHFQWRRLIVVFGASDDKDSVGMAREIREWADQVIVTQAAHPRAAPVDRIKELFPADQVRVARTVGEARHLALAMAVSEDVVVVCGSLFIVAEFRDAYQR